MPRFLRTCSSEGIISQVGSADALSEEAKELLRLNAICERHEVSWKNAKTLEKRNEAEGRWMRARAKYARRGLEIAHRILGRGWELSSTVSYSDLRTIAAMCSIASHMGVRASDVREMSDLKFTVGYGLAHAVLSRRPPIQSDVRKPSIPAAGRGERERASTH